MRDNVMQSTTLRPNAAALVAAGGLHARLIHTATIRGLPVRFYSSPRWEPDMPWCCLQDILKVTCWGNDRIPGVVQHLRERMTAMVHDLEDGFTIIADFAAGGLFYYVMDLGWAEGKSTLTAYQDASSTVMCARYAYLDRDDFRAVVQQAGLRALPFVEGEHRVQ